MISYFRWEEIVSILANRRNFIVNCAELAHAHFQMVSLEAAPVSKSYDMVWLFQEDVETAKYAAYVCGLHLQFFRNFCKRDDGYVIVQRLSSLPFLTSKGPFLGAHLPVDRRQHP